MYLLTSLNPVRQGVCRGEPADGTGDEDADDAGTEVVGGEMLGDAGGETGLGDIDDDGNGDGTGSVGMLDGSGSSMSGLPSGSLC